jgi:hypothetical protein
MRNELILKMENDSFVKLSEANLESSRELAESYLESLFAKFK